MSTFQGSSGNDVLPPLGAATSGDDIFIPQLGQDNVDGGEGTDLLIVDYSSNTHNGTTPQSGINGAANSDGTGGFYGSFYTYRDTIIGSGGDDCLNVAGDNDLIIAGAGNDTIYSNKGIDSIDGEDGIDARCLPTLKPGVLPTQKAWGELKPDKPRVDAQKTRKKGEGQVRKHEVPLAEAKGIFFPKVPPELADKIYARYGVNPTAKQRESGFWPCVYWHPQIEIHITEGKKKAEADISQGYACLALSSVTGGYRSTDAEGNRLQQRVLHDELAVFAQAGRPIKMLFDQDKKRETIERVKGELVKTGELLQDAGCDVRVVKWKGHKGCDDFIVNNGAGEWLKRLDLAMPLDWTAQQHYASEYWKLSAWVQKQNGKIPDQRKLDVALIAIFRDNPDAIKILCHSPAIKNASVDEAEAYIVDVYRESQKVKQKIRNQLVLNLEL
ncbi:MAG: DUF3854 domain-containing protein [Thermosynechococcaceae cyanobacterium MS004]|nr:DUF3854 domain-containing protein [Thermosynechococcaceae cyanobacterium MS004]